MWSGCVISHCSQESRSVALLRCLPRDPVRTEYSSWGTASNTINLTLFNTLVLLKPEAVMAAGEGVHKSVICVVLLSCLRSRCRCMKLCGFCCQQSPCRDPHSQDGKCQRALNHLKGRLFCYWICILRGTEDLPAEVCSETTLLHQLQISIFCRCTFIFLFFLTYLWGWIGLGKEKDSLEHLYMWKLELSIRRSRKIPSTPHERLHFHLPLSVSCFNWNFSDQKVSHQAWFALGPFTSVAAVLCPGAASKEAVLALVHGRRK